MLTSATKLFDIIGADKSFYICENVSVSALLFLELLLVIMKKSTLGCGVVVEVHLENRSTNKRRAWNDDKCQLRVTAVSLMPTDFVRDVEPMHFCPKNRSISNIYRPRIYTKNLVFFMG